MPDPIRLFVAVNVPLLLQLRPILKSLDAMGPPVQTVAEETSHVTLKFLGDTSSSLLEEIQSRVIAAAAQASPFVIKVHQLGAFPNSDRPSVVWAGLMNADPLIELAKQLDALLEPLGFVPESRPFHPHLTLARIKGHPPQPLFDLLRSHQQTTFGEFAVNTIELFRSELHRDGSRYTVISSHVLGGS